MELHEKLDKLSKSNMLPMHMPGHKRNRSLIEPEFLCDITEIEGFDDLHAASGVIRRMTDDCRRIWKSSRSFISVNGASALLLSAICACSSPGDKLLLSSDCHISIWHAVEMNDLIPVPVPLKREKSLPFAAGCDTEKAVRKLEADPAIKLAVITTPGYEGAVCDTSKIHEIMRKRGGLLIVDASHGSHFGMDRYFPARPEGDIIINSTHKTLNSPTQTAVMNSYSPDVPAERIDHFLSIFESSSPSYILMKGLSRALSDLASDPACCRNWAKALSGTRDTLRGLSHLSLWEGEGADPSKLVILTNGYMSGHALSDMLRDSYRIEVEASFGRYIIAMTGMGDTASSLRRFSEALINIDELIAGRTPCGQTEEEDIILSVPERVTGIREALSGPAAAVDPSEAAGRIAAEFIFCYPPGTPVIIPGTRIDQSAVSYLLRASENGDNIKTDPYRVYDGKIKVR